MRDDDRDRQVSLGWFRLPRSRAGAGTGPGALVVIARPWWTGIHRASMMKPSSATGISSTNATQIAHHRGADLGTTERNRTRPGRLSAERALTLVTAVLTRYGFEPDRATPTLLRLRNCPFQPQASKAPQLVCGINHAFITGFLTTLQAGTLTAVLAPRAGECCVELTAD